MTLSSDRLGLTAKIDLLEGAGRQVVPVDIKGGHGPPPGKQPWEPELVHLAVQGLVLRDAGYECDRGVLSFLGSHRRFDVEFDESLLQRTLQLVAEMREAALAATAPPPLIDSPKCPTCIHNSVCLPDEINLLTGRQADRPLRRLTPSADNAAPLYVNEQGSHLRKDRGRIEVWKGDQRIASVRAIDVNHVSVFGNVSVSTPLMRQLLAEDITVAFFTYGGWFSGIAHGMPTKNVSLRIRQYRCAERGDLAAARRIVHGKIRNSRTLLMRNGRQRADAVVESLRRLASDALDAPSVDVLLGTEGAAARLYFSQFASMLRADDVCRDFDFDGRNRRPPRDRVNCLLSFAYGLLVRELTSAVIGVGLDPLVGVYH
ncbi:MAG: CRISPR-associated endonuclease Cas1, partial [Steroidobacteraceae bacterium]